MKFFTTGLIALALLFILLVAGGYLYLRTSLPKTEGEIQIAGITQPVSILRDASGVPHIKGQNFQDVMFGLGFVHAQDRLWQMEMNRRTGAGRLSEVLGNATLETDKFLRTVGFYQAAKASYAKFDGQTKKLIKSYTKGVNAFLDQQTGALPPEFLILGVKPEKWTPIDSVVWTKMMAWDLGKNWSNEVARLQLSNIMSLSEVNEFFPPYPGEKIVPLPDFENEYQLANLELQKLLTAAPAILPTGAGSNNWVVSGDKTQSGRPLLANDPHLGLSAPSLWYFAHLEAPGLNAIGATLPGVPGIILGRNDRIAWGFTNTGPDTQDLYVEKINLDNPHQYKTPDGWQEFKTRQEIIRIKDQPDVTLTVRITRHGPVLSDIYKAVKKDIPENHVLALGWTSLMETDGSMMASSRMMTAQNWEEFKKAIQLFTSPQQNMVYADIDGNIGYYAPANIPVRNKDNLAMGRLPVPGWLKTYDWEGFIPFEDLPQSYNPTKGFLYSANEKIVPEDYPHFITSDWAKPYRAKRIQERLEQEEKHTFQTFSDMHTDVRSLMALEIMDILLTTKPANDLSRKALTALSIWDGRMTIDQNAPLIFNGWIRELNKAIYADELQDLFPRYWRHRPTFIRNVLLNVNGQSRWCDNRNTEKTETCNEILQTSLALTLEDLQKRYGDNLDHWEWGTAHFAHSDHLPFSKVSLLKNIFDISVPSAGGTYTINVGRNKYSDESQPFANTHAASLRAIYDLSNLNNSMYIQSTGQSGNIVSKYYSDMADEWAAVKYRKMSTDPADYTKNAIGTLILKP
ncbi:penicillin acylase family protein [Sneathiella sp.]|jgi:penicillin amidase|uniref:penicillin acylase family protein n=1 Tax=Sneathiella sp. TaxID=1964365 RepID=UPI0039E4030D